MNIYCAISDFKVFVQQRLAAYFDQPVTGAPFTFKIQTDKVFPSIGRAITAEELVMILTAAATHFQPTFFDDIIKDFIPAGGDFPEFGGIKGANTRYMLPTGDTALFILGGKDVKRRADIIRLFSTTHWFYKDKFLWLEAVKEGEPKWSGRLVLSNDFIDQLTTGHIDPPAFGPGFSAKLITTRQNWNDVVLPAGTQAHLKDLYAWLQHNETAMLDPVLNRKIKPGYRALFYGPGGTGKTLVASLLGQEFNKAVYRVDLSQVVSKYIGETEKNLENVFAKAESQDWILFFDEADALFGKRSNVQSAHDKYANQEVSYLLQRVEDFPRMVILASNFKSNIDQAFLRRFNSIIEFPFPGTAERRLLWQKAMPQLISVAPDIDLQYLAAKYELTGSNINQVVHQAVLQMHYKKAAALTQELLLQAILKELRKDNKLLS